MSVLVHGFQYDPRAKGEDNPNTNTFPRWDEMLGVTGAERHSWFSVPMTWKNFILAPLNGYWNRYTWAWALALEEASRVAMRLGNSAEKPDIICHSLGTRVVLAALEQDAPAGRVLLLNGAEYLDKAANVARNRPDVEFFSVIVGTDDVLNSLGRFAPGFGGRFVGNTPLGLGAPPNWTDLPLDNVIFRGLMQQLYGWDIQGDNPDQIGDHWYSFEYEGNWPLYRAIFAREWPVRSD